MLNKKEITIILLVTLIFAFTATLIDTFENFLIIFLIFLLVICINVFSKKLASYYLDSEIEIKIWEIERYGFTTKQKLKKAFPAGAFFPILSKIVLLPFKNFIWTASLIFDIKPKKYRAVKRKGIYSFSEMTEFEIGLIAASGIFMNLLFSVLGYFLGFPTFTKLNIYYAFFNLLPISDLDGNKIFFGNQTLWSFLGILALTGLIAAILII